MRIYTFVIWAALIVACGVNAAAQVENDIEIRKIESQWLIEPYKTGDMKAFDEIVADDFRITHSNGSVLTKSEKRADILKNQIKSPPPQDVFEVDEKSVSVSFHDANTAVSKGFIIENYMWKGDRYLDHVHFTNTYLKKGGRWRVVSSHLTRLNKKKTEGETGFIDVGDTRLFYQKLGSGEQVLVIPLHLYLFEDFKHLAKNRTVIFYDVRNRGASERVEDTSKLTIHEDVEDLEKLRRHFGVSKMSLIGESYVGLMVVMYAMKYPQYVEKLIQIGPVALKFGTQYPVELTANDPSPVPDPAKEAEIEKLREEGFHKSNPREFCEREWAVTATMLVGNEELASRVKSPCEHPNEWAEALDRHFEYHFVSVQKLDIPKTDVQKVKIPVLTIHGTKDRNAPYGGGKEWSEILPNATLLTVKGAAHVPWIDEPEIVFGAIEKFLPK